MNTNTREKFAGPEHLDPDLIHIMIDCETLSLQDNAALVSIGVAVMIQGREPLAVVFTPRLLEQLQEGAMMSRETLMFHLEQGTGQVDLSRQHAEGDDPAEALSVLADWLDDLCSADRRRLRIWTQGDKDWVWITAACERHDVDLTTFDFWQFRDSRTLLKACGVSREGPVLHEAGADCEQQARAVLACWDKFVVKEEAEAEPLECPHIWHLDASDAGPVWTDTTLKCERCGERRGISEPWDGTTARDMIQESQAQR